MYMRSICLEESQWKAQLTKRYPQKQECPSPPAKNGYNESGASLKNAFQVNEIFEKNVRFPFERECIY